MGTCIAFGRACALHDSNSRLVPLEFSMATIFPSCLGSLCGGSAAAQAGFSDPGYGGAWPCYFDERCRIYLSHNWFVRFPAHLDFSWIGLGLGLFGTPATSLGVSPLDSRRDYILRVARHVSLHPD